jgi:hypothetical protein
VDEPVERLDVSAYTVPTDGPDGEESDGTLTWDSTTMIVVEAHGGGDVGVGTSTTTCEWTSRPPSGDL